MDDAETEGNLELLAEKQVLHDEALTAADGGDEGGQEEPDEFKHRGRIDDPRSQQDRRTVFCPPTPAPGYRVSASSFLPSNPSMSSGRPAMPSLP